jgi:hypothetical protein
MDRLDESGFPNERCRVGLSNCFSSSREAHTVDRYS